MAAPLEIPDRPGTYRRACPACAKGPRDDALAVTVEGDGGAVWICHRCGFKGGIPNAGAEARPARRAAPADGAATKTTRARRLIAEARPAAGSPVERYLAGRALELPPDTPLLYHPAAFHWPSRTRRPCMVAPVVPISARDDDPPQAAHLTFLAEHGEGKADIEKPRLYFGPKAGGVVKLIPDSEVTTGLAVAEGVETGLAARMAGLNTWAALDAGNLAKFPALSGIEALTIVADHDRAGIDAAEAVARRWREAGREVRVYVPDAERADLNDRAVAAAR